MSFVTCETTAMPEKTNQNEQNWSQEIGSMTWHKWGQNHCIPMYVCVSVCVCLCVPVTRVRGILFLLFYCLRQKLNPPYDKIDPSAFSIWPGAYNECQTACLWMNRRMHQAKEANKQKHKKKTTQENKQAKRDKTNHISLVHICENICTNSWNIMIWKVSQINGCQCQQWLKHTHTHIHNHGQCYPQPSRIGEQ